MIFVFIGYKTLWEKEKMLVTSIFSFPTMLSKALFLRPLKLAACSINSLPNDKVLDLTKLKAFADNKINVTQMLKFSLGRVENVEKGENAGYQHFLLF